MNENIRDKALDIVDQRKGAAVGELGTLAGALRRAGTELSENSGLAGTAVNTIAERVESISKSLDGKDLRTVMGDVEQFARRNPVAFVGGAVALGFIASRFLKSDPTAVPAPQPQSSGGAQGSFAAGSDGSMGGMDTPMGFNSESEFGSGSGGSMGGSSRFSSMPGSDVISDSPMIAGLAALAVGAIFGAIVPETTREHQLFGETKNNLKEKAANAARQKVAETISAVAGTHGSNKNNEDTL
jgi:hypothetical protein